MTRIYDLIFSLICSPWPAPLEVVARTEFLIITVNGIGRMWERRTWLVVALHFIISNYLVADM